MRISSLYGIKRKADISPGKEVDDQLSESEIIIDRTLEHPTQTKETEFYNQNILK